MGRRYSILLVIVVGTIIGCSKSNDTQTVKQDDPTKNTIVQKTEDATSYFIPSQADNEKKNSLFVFAGEKIEVTKLPYEAGDFDSAFLAKYKVIDKYYGDCLKDIIEFKVFDHYGDPPFSKYKFALLFVSFYKGKFYHEKYQYFDLYKTKDGEWASPYPTGDYQHEYNRKTSIKPEKIEFADDVYYDVSGMDKKEVKEWYPAPYYQIDRGKARAVYGNYIPELFKLKRNGILKARELF